MKIDGIAAIVTGGASGLGAATASMLAKSGAKVTIFDLGDSQGLETAARLSCAFHKVDVTLEADVVSGLAAAETAHGTARILVNCAGVAPAIKVVGRDFDPHSIREFRRIIDINLIGSFIVLSHFAAKLMAGTPLEDERGVIVNTASIAAFDGQIGHAAYSASKAGLVGLALPVARELARARIRIMTIAPGLFHTPIVAGLPSVVQDAVLQQVLYPSRMGEPNEFADLVQAIINNPMLNGETIRIDGAVRLPPR